MFEYALPIWVGGTLAGLLAVMAALSRRTPASIATLVAVPAVTLALAYVERRVVTPREQVEAAVEAALAAVETNDPSAVLRHVGPNAADIRDEVVRFLRTARVERCHAAGSIDVRLSGEGQAVASFEGLLNGYTSDGGARLAYFDRVDLEFEQSAVDASWNIVGYTA